MTLGSPVVPSVRLSKGGFVFEILFWKVPNWLPVPCTPHSLQSYNIKAAANLQHERMPSDTCLVWQKRVRQAFRILQTKLLFL